MSDLLNNIDQAITLIKSGNMNDAKRYFERVDTADITSQNLCVRYAYLAALLQDFSRAAEYYRRVVDQNPENAVLLGCLGEAYLNDGQFGNAAKYLQEAYSLNPKANNVLVNLSSALLQSDNAEDCVSLLESAVERDSDNPSLLANLAIALTKTGNFDQALSVAEKTVVLDPSNAIACHTAGNALMILGEMQNARVYLEKAIEIDPFYAAAYSTLSRVARFSDRDEVILEKARGVYSAITRSSEKVHLSFFLGKAADDMEQWDQAFQYYTEGNEALKAGRECESPESILANYKKVFSCGFSEGEPQAYSKSVQPLFIVGMPRSGTTLLQQMLCGHSGIETGGELMFIPEAVENMGFHLSSCPFVAGNHGVLQSNLTDQANTVRAGYARYISSEQTCFVIDKLPDNFLHLGLIYKMFPLAKVIHLSRNPFDTALSCYFQFFANHVWSCDLEWIAQRYLLYQEAMLFWRQTLPEEGFILDVQYEDLIVDGKRELEKIMSFLGLGWESGCLNPELRSGEVRTSSMWQVRQQVYSTSCKRYWPYRKYLQGFSKQINTDL